MIDQNEEEKKSTNEQSTGTSRRSVLSMAGAGIAALGVGSTGSVKADSGTVLSTDPEDWSAKSGDIEQGGVYANTNMDPGTAEYVTGVSLGYNERGVTKYSTTATDAGQVDLKWKYDVNHSVRDGATVRISINNDDTTYLVGPNKEIPETFLDVGTTTLSLNEGDEVTVMVHPLPNSPPSLQPEQCEGEVSIVTPDNLQANPPAWTIASNNPGSWNSSGPGTHDVSGGDGSVELTYDTDNLRENTWQYKTTAQSNTTLEVDWSYDGNHSWYNAEAEAYIRVNNEETELVEKETHGNFSASGKTQISVSEGDTVRVGLRGDHYDSSRIMNGTFTASFSKTSEASNIAPNNPGSWNSSGPGTHDVSGGDGSVELTYDTDNLRENTWQYKTTAQSNTTLEVDWSYDGNHSWYNAEAEAYIRVNNEETELVEKETHGNFSASGKTQISVSEGDTVRVGLRGYHYDSSRIMNGTFTASFSEK